jgi:hypothetical protein
MRGANNVHAIGVRSVEDVLDGDAFDVDAVAAENMNRPRRRVFDGHAFDPHLPAIGKLHEMTEGNAVHLHRMFHCAGGTAAPFPSEEVGERDVEELRAVADQAARPAHTRVSHSRGVNPNTIREIKSQPARELMLAACWGELHWRHAPCYLVGLAQGSSNYRN